MSTRDPEIDARDPEPSGSAAPEAEGRPVLSVENLRVELALGGGRTAPVVDDVSFEIRAGETLGVVGESGCGKSMTALAIMGLLPENVGRIAGGRIRLDGQDLVTLAPAGLRAVRGKRVSMIFQEPMSSLNPLYPIGEQIAEVLRLHEGLAERAAWERAVELLDAVRLPNPRARAADYPHQLSGGQRQRVMIAIALACEPEVLIADEPTTALDVTVQAEIFGLLGELGRARGTAIILITHDMGAVAEMADRMIVMYAGRVVEEGTVGTVIERPRHPYTEGLISCVPHLVATLTDERPELAEIGGIVPGLPEFGAEACLFASRCPHTLERCLAERPRAFSFADGQHTACWFAEER